MPSPAIEVVALGKTYPGSGREPVRALDGVSFQVPEGGVFGLLGPNGAGKSTLVRVLSTITAPTSGRASILGCDVSRDALEVRRRIAVVLQQAAVETLLTVRDNLLIYARLHGVPSFEAGKRLRGVAEEFGLGDKLDETVQDLSIGTKRRIQVAKIFMVDSPVIFLDEATTGMDPFMKRAVLERIRAEAGKGRTVLLTTQILSEAEQLCDTIMILDRGRTLASGTLEELRRLAKRMFRVSLSFESLDEGALDRLRALEPAELKVEGLSVELLFEGSEAKLLEQLAAVARQTPITRFEVRGADLEEIFIRLVTEAAA